MSQFEPAGALIVSSRPFQRCSRPLSLGPRTVSLPSSKLTLTWSSRSSALEPDLLAMASTVSTSVASPEIATLPAAHGVMLIAAGSGHGNSQVVMTVSFRSGGLRVVSGCWPGALAAGEAGVARSDRWSGPGPGTAARRCVQRVGNGPDQPGIDGR